MSIFELYAYALVPIGVLMALFTAAVFLLIILVLVTLPITKGQPFLWLLKGLINSYIRVAEKPWSWYDGLWQKGTEAQLIGAVVGLVAIFSALVAYPLGWVTIARVVTAIA